MSDQPDSKESVSVTAPQGQQTSPKCMVLHTWLSWFLWAALECKVHVVSYKKLVNDKHRIFWFLPPCSTRMPLRVSFGSRAAKALRHKKCGNT
eukprot:5574574-Amphidinium_carterae.1